MTWTTVQGFTTTAMQTIIDNAKKGQTKVRALSLTAKLLFSPFTFIFKEAASEPPMSILFYY